MKSIKKIALFLTGGILVSLFLILVFKYLSAPGEIEYRSEQFISGKRAFASLENASLTQSIDNEVIFKIKAKKAYIRNRKVGFLRIAFQKVMEMEGVSISFYKNGVQDVSIRSDRAILYPGSKDVQFIGNVVCTAGDGRELRTERLLWDNDVKVFKASESYEYTTQRGVLITGAGSDFDLNLKRVKTGYTPKDVNHIEGGVRQ